MSEEKNIDLSLCPKLVEKTVENLLDKPTKSIGDTFDEIWYLILGGSVAQLAEKRKMKYAVELEKFKRTIVDEIEKIPDKNLKEVDIQVVGPILEASKYCAEKEQLRSMFAKLIASAMDSRKENTVHPILSDIISKMSNVDAFLFKVISCELTLTPFPLSADVLLFSMTTLSRLGVIEMPDLKEETDIEQMSYTTASISVSVNGVDVSPGKKILENKKRRIMREEPILALQQCNLTRIGKILKEICID